MRKKILITGGSGFIGRNLLEQLGATYTVVAPRHAELELLNPKAVKDFLKFQRFDIIIHSATSPSHRKIREPRDIVYKNVKIFFNIARNSDCFGKMILLGSGAEYGQQYDIKEAKETDFDLRVPEDEHGFSKYVCSKYIEKSDNFINLRLFGIFGKYEDYQIRFISNVLCKTLYDLPITLKQNRKFSYLYIDDLGKIIAYFIENKAGEKIYNVVPDEKVELLSLAKLVRKISGKNVEINVAQEGMGLEYTGDNNRLMQEIKGLQFTRIDDATRQLYSWYEKNRDNIREELLLVDP